MACLKNEFTEDEKCHDLLTWFVSYSMHMSKEYRSSEAEKLCTQIVSLDRFLIVPLDCSLSPCCSCFCCLDDDLQIRLKIEFL